MADIPNIEVKVMPQGRNPKGIGETGPPSTTGVVANAARVLDGADLTQVHFTPERVKSAMKG